MSITVNDKEIQTVRREWDGQGVLIIKQYTTNKCWTKSDYLITNNLLLCKCLKENGIKRLKWLFAQLQRQLGSNI
jgi:hypothetical protein